MSGQKLPYRMLNTDPGQAAVLRAYVDGATPLVLASAFRWPSGTTFQEQTDAVIASMESFIERHAPEMLQPEFRGVPVVQAKTALARYIAKHPELAARVH